MRKSKRQQKALRAMNLDLFQPETLTPPAPATLYDKIRRQARVRPDQATLTVDPPKGELPSIDELYRMFDRFNWQYFDGKLPKARIEYSNRMTSAGSYTPADKLIRIGRKYHEIFPQDVEDTLKHEMIHLLHFRHDANFKREAARIGCSVKARPHPSLRRPPKYIYRCPCCGRDYPRQKRLRMASCGYCSKGGRYDDRFKLKLYKSPNKKN